MDQKISPGQLKTNKSVLLKNIIIGWLILIGLPILFDCILIFVISLLRENIFSLILVIFCAIGIIISIPFGIVFLFKKANIKKAVRRMLLVIFLALSLIFVTFLIGELIGDKYKYLDGGKKCSDGGDCFSGKCVYDVSAVCGVVDLRGLDKCIKELSDKGIIVGNPPDDKLKHEGHCARSLNPPSCVSNPFFIPFYLDDRGVITHSYCDDGIEVVGL